MYKWDVTHFMTDIDRLLYYVDNSSNPERMLTSLNKCFKVDDPYFRIERNEITETNSQFICNPMSYEVINEKSFFVQIKSFSGDNFQSNIMDMVGKMQEFAIENIVFDLRDNTGGRLDNALYLLERFSATQGVDIVGNINYIISTPNKHDHDIVLKKIIIIVNENTISAAELVTLAFRIRGALVIGNTTFGKSEIQENFRINDKYKLKISVGKFLVNKIDIEGIGITPDVFCINCNKDIYDLYKSITGGEASFVQAVMFIQKVLKELKEFHHEINGEYDSYTISMVKKYKSERGILVNDFITRVLIDSLYKDTFNKNDIQKEKAESLLKE